MKTLRLPGSLPQYVNYALKSSFVTVFLETLPEIASKLKEPKTKVREFEDFAKEAEEAAAMVLVY
ncbi:MAG: hypothetical protein ABIV39_08755 [Verrucomicrobiota bacterium]